MNQGSEEARGTMEKTRTNLAWPTLGDSDVPPAEERANHIHTYSLMVARERGATSFRGDGDRGATAPRARTHRGAHAGRTSRIGRT
jgi:hypothetical protein